jgi:hypothetical protein
MDDGAGCGRAGEIEDACALIENDDASTPQVRTNDNLLNIERTPLFAAFLGTSRGIPWNGSTRWRFLSKSQALLPGFSLRMVDCGLTRDRLFTIPALRGGTKDAAPGELSRPTVKSTSCLKRMPNRLAAPGERTGGAPKDASVLRRAPSGAPPRRYSSLRPPLTPRRWHRPRERGLTRRPPVPTAVCEAKTPEAGSRYSCRRAPGRGEPLEPVLVPAASSGAAPLAPRYRRSAARVLTDEGWGKLSAATRSGDNFLRSVSEADVAVSRVPRLHAA